MKRRKWYAIVMALLLSLVMGSFAPEMAMAKGKKSTETAEEGSAKKKKKKKKNKKSKKKKNEENAEETATQTAAPEQAETKEDKQAKLDMRLYGSYLGSYANDSTGNWRRYSYESEEDLTAFAADYYEAYFGGNDEIHVLVNAQQETTAIVAYMYGSLDVRVYQMDSRDIDDAKVAPGGAKLREFWLALSTGEITEVEE